MSSILVYRNGQEYGPFSVEEVKSYLASGNISNHDHARFSDENEWVAIKDIIERIQVHVQELEQEVASKAVLSDAGDRPSEVRKSRSNLSLGLALLSLLCCGPLLAVPAIIVAHKERTHGERNGKTLAALLIGYFSIIFYLLMAVVVGLAPSSPSEGIASSKVENDSVPKVSFRVYGTVIQRLDNGYLINAIKLDKGLEEVEIYNFNSNQENLVTAKTYFVACDNPTLVDDDKFDMTVYDTGTVYSYSTALGTQRTVRVFKPF